jgi:hypothetical protein
MLHSASLRNLCKSTSAAALSLLRRAHAHHRDLRTLDAAARAARSTRGAVVTRRGFIPTPCRCHVAPANGTSRAHHRVGVVTLRRFLPLLSKTPTSAPDIGRDRQEMLSRCASNQAQSTSRPSTPAQPKHQIAISRALHIAGSLLGNFPTPDGVRNSSRKQTGGFGWSRANSGRWLNAVQRVECRGCGHSS